MTMDQEQRQDKNKSGLEWELELARCVQEFALVDHATDGRVEEWQERYAAIESKLEDKYLAKRHAIRRAEEEAEHFQYLADMYAKNAKKFTNLAEKIKRLALRDMQVHADTTGEKEIKLKDNTTIRMYTRKGKQITCAVTGKPVDEWDDARIGMLPDSLVRRTVKVGALKKHLEKTPDFDLQVVDVETQFVRWI